ncbi:hypothetical protein HMPREF1869_00705 [Bacteroidales bacterium KA00251]|nr:hypothetical protein HMPREF1869_00705 [Bacteroidales bacterium KA00251]
MNLQYLFLETSGRISEKLRDFFSNFVAFFSYKSFVLILLTLYPYNSFFV